MEYTFSKIEIASYLRHSVAILSAANLQPDIPFHKLSEQILINDNNQQAFCGDYYEDTFKIFLIYLTTKALAVSNDAYFDNLKESDIDTTAITKDIFVNERDFNRFSKKQIINYIRNALVHNNGVNDLYKIKRVDDEIKIEISLLLTNPIPFHVIISNTTLASIFHELAFSSTKLQLLSVKTKRPCKINNLQPELLNNIFFRKYNLKTTTKTDDIKDFYYQDDKDVLSTLKANSFSIKDYNLSLVQAHRVLELVETAKQRGITNLEYFLPIMLLSTAPISLNPERMMNTFYIYGKLFSNKYKTYQEAVTDICTAPQKTQKYDVTNPMISYNNLELCDNFILENTAIYFQFMFDSIIKDKTITVGTTDYDSERFRNSLVHSRWFGGAHHKMCFLDWGNGEKNENIPNWKATVKFKDILTAVEKQYKNLAKGNQIIADSPIHVRVLKNTSPETPNTISFTKDNKGYFYHITDANVCKVYVTTGGKPTPANKEELELFLNEMQHLIKEEQEQYSDIIKTATAEISKLIKNFKIKTC